MRITVVTLAGRELPIEVDNGSTVRQIKEKVEEREGIPPEQQRLVFSGKHIEDHELISTSGLGEGARVNLVLSLKGGK